MNEKRIKEIEQSFEKLPDLLRDQFLCVSSIPELIAALRDAQKPLGEMLHPTLHALTEASFGLHDSGLESKVAIVELELDRLRQLLPDNEKGKEKE